MNGDAAAGEACKRTGGSGAGPALHMQPVLGSVGSSSSHVEFPLQSPLQVVCLLTVTALQPSSASGASVAAAAGRERADASGTASSPCAVVARSASTRRPLLDRGRMGTGRRSLVDAPATVRLHAAARRCLRPRPAASSSARWRRLDGRTRQTPGATLLPLGWRQLACGPHLDSDRVSGVIELRDAADFKMNLIMEDFEEHFLAHHSLRSTIVAPNWFRDKESDHAPSLN